MPMVDAKWWGESDDDQAVSLKEFQSFWLDTVDMISDLDEYDKLWIKHHSCVWSECAIDDTDDNYMGDNRDGDEQWYQYRTQGFCANAAFSLYGRKKDDGLSFRACTRRHFINSFFTYGGADTLLKSIGETPIFYNYDNGDDDANDDGNNDDDNGYDDEVSANAACVEIEYDESEDNEDNDDNSNSGSNDNDGYSASLGCSTDGNYVIAAFQSSSCDGNYFTDVVDDFEDYNDQHSAIGCHKIYDSNVEVSVENIITLMNNSWSCDLRLYPNGCPDPFGEKEKFDFAMRTVAHGGNPNLAYKNMVFKTPMHITSWILLAVSILILLITYIIKNESRAIRSKGGKNMMGYLRCVAEDIAIGCRLFGAWINLKWAAFVINMTGEKTDRSSEKENSFEKDNSDVSTSDDYVHVDEEAENKDGSNSGKDMQRSFTAPSILMTEKEP
eukprot:CAMPEP_0197184568 /NCGR_PEP_ID=MMETSP1423-20130617/10125_1 /TAXON_ID=476441 /ORGANISM="Pseudo-nitzschia heimii, Strain UNC1101" /LENGTH=441 /DNA_ID=CAMNT_0042635411 /DNA_START=102 /DNA_END=1427 /DNA_ORIENTATION=+